MYSAARCALDQEFSPSRGLRNWRRIMASACAWGIAELATPPALFVLFMVARRTHIGVGHAALSAESLLPGSARANFS